MTFFEAGGLSRQYSCVDAGRAKPRINLYLFIFILLGPRAVLCENILYFKVSRRPIVRALALTLPLFEYTLLLTYLHYIVYYALSVYISDVFQPCPRPKTAQPMSFRPL